MFHSSLKSLSRVFGVALVGATLIAAPAFANNGGGHGNNGGGHGNSGASTHGNSGNGTNNGGSDNGMTASSLGALNGFMHVSVQGFTHASANSRIGKMRTYMNDLQTYLACTSSTCNVTLTQLAADLQAAANKPLSQDIISMLNTRLETFNSSLSTSIDAYTSTSTTTTTTTPLTGADALAADIYGAI